MREKTFYFRNKSFPRNDLEPFQCQLKIKPIKDVCWVCCCCCDVNVIVIFVAVVVVDDVDVVVVVVNDVVVVVDVVVIIVIVDFDAAFVKEFWQP